MFNKAFTAIALTAALAACAPTTPAIVKTVIPTAQGDGPNEDPSAHSSSTTSSTFLIPAPISRSLTRAPSSQA
jgi:hypothetical protein